ncbi:hypothetical protein NMY22_g12633 [Coprinellus aureogranulatus]|nr:hypothetical protein NMY22_g12633 [Coprinellus aureogranulatus]
MFPQSDFPCAAFLPIPWLNVLEEVLAPEAAVLLIMDDLKVDQEEAVNILHASRTFGIARHPLKDDDNLVVKSEDVAIDYPTNQHPQSHATTIWL